MPARVTARRVPARPGASSAPPGKAAKGGGRQQAQAQAAKQGAVDLQTAVAAAKQLLRISVFNILFAREIFPGDAFAQVSVAKLNNLSCNVLNPKHSPHALRVIDWLAHGVSDALDRRYLHRLRLTISAEPAGRDLLEEYSFKFSYSADSAVELRVDASKKAGPERVHFVPVSTADDLRKQISQLSRLLITAMATFDVLPAEKHFNIILDYLPHCPADYEPPYFGVNTEHGQFAEEPFALRLGGVGTEDLAVGLNIKSRAVSGQPKAVPRARPAPPPAGPTGAARPPAKARAKAAARLPAGGECRESLATEMSSPPEHGLADLRLADPAEPALDRRTGNPPLDLSLPVLSDGEEGASDVTRDPEDGEANAAAAAAFDDDETQDPSLVWPTQQTQDTWATDVSRQSKRKSSKGLPVGARKQKKSRQELMTQGR